MNDELSRRDYSSPGMSVANDGQALYCGIFESPITTNDSVMP